MNDANSPLNLVLLGATGRVGRLLHAGFDVLSETNTANIRIWSQTRNNPPPDHAHWFHWDAGDSPQRMRFLAKTLRARIKGAPDALLCLAGVSPPKRPLADNTRIALAALDLARALGTGRVLLASSSAVYGPQTGLAPLSETTLPAPRTDYGRAKLAMEQAAQNWRKSRPLGPAITCLRVGNVAGADQLLRTAARATPDAPLLLDRFADGRGPLRSYIGPRSLAAVILSLMRAPALPGVLNVAAPRPVEMAELLAAGRTCWRFRPAPPEALPRACLETRALETYHRFAPADSTPAGILHELSHCAGQE